MHRTFMISVHCSKTSARPMGLNLHKPSAEFCTELTGKEKKTSGMLA
jgi:hypothetical protein